MESAFYVKHTFCIQYTFNIQYTFYALLMVLERPRKFNVF